MDATRRLFGALLGRSGIGARESQFRYVAEMAGAKLRSYQSRVDTRTVPILIVPAPFKQPYVWDLHPAVSVIRRCRSRNFPVYALEWSAPTTDGPGYGLADFADHIPSAAIEAVAAQTGRNEVVLIGHSLGGTLAATCAALHPHKTAALVLIETPLSFAGSGPLQLAAAGGMPCHSILQLVGNPVPGSAVNLMSVAAAPDVFYWYPMTDLLAIIGDAERLTIHAAARRWTLDELAMPGGLFTQVVEWLYREDRLINGRLRLSGRPVGLSDIRAPTLAVVNPKGTSVPPRLTLKGLASATGPVTIFQHPSEAGTVLERIGALIGLRAHAQLWPLILDLARGDGLRPVRRSFLEQAQ